MAIYKREPILATPVSCIFEHLSTDGLLKGISYRVTTDHLFIHEKRVKGIKAYQKELTIYDS